MLIYEIILVLFSNISDVQAKQQYKQEERKKQLKRQRGEDTWMLPEINQRLQEIQDVRHFFFFFFYIRFVPVITVQCGL